MRLLEPLAVDPAGDLIVTGYSSRPGTGGDYATLKYSSAGTPVWTNYFHRTFGDQPAALVVDAAGRLTGRQAVAHAFALLLVSLLPSGVGMAGRVYLVGALLLGAWATLRVWQQGEQDEARPADAIVVLGAAQYDVVFVL